MTSMFYHFFGHLRCGPIRRKLNRKIIKIQAPLPTPGNLLIHIFLFHLLKAIKNKQVFLRPLFLKTDEAGRFLSLLFISPKQMTPLFSFFFSSKTIKRHLFLVHCKFKNVDILILTNKINEATFLSMSEKRTHEGHLKQMREGLRNDFCLGQNFYIS